MNYSISNTAEYGEYILTKIINKRNEKRNEEAIDIQSGKFERMDGRV